MIIVCHFNLYAPRILILSVEHCKFTHKYGF